MKLIGYLFSSAIIFGLGLSVMLFGWGLKPISWGWVIWGNIGALVLAAIVQVAADES